MHKNNFAEHACKRAQIIAFGDRNGSSIKVTEYVTNKEIENDKYTSTGTGTTPGACARARNRSNAADSNVGDKSEVLENLGEYYCETFNRTRGARVVMQDMAAALEAGIQPDVVMLAMDDTARAEKPTWAYCLAILKRCQREGILTADAWHRQKEQRSGGRTRRGDGASKSAPQTGATGYSQRDYNEADYATDAIMQLWNKGTM